MSSSKAAGLEILSTKTLNHIERPQRNTWGGNKSTLNTWHVGNAHARAHCTCRYMAMPTWVIRLLGISSPASANTSKSSCIQPGQVAQWVAQEQKTLHNESRTAWDEPQTSQTTRISKAIDSVKRYGHQANNTTNLCCMPLLEGHIALQCPHTEI